MAPQSPGSLPPGRQPYDALNGLRVGALAGALLGGAATALAGVAYAWLVVAGGVLGGAAGYGWERSRSGGGRPPRTETDDSG